MKINNSNSENRDFQELYPLKDDYKCGLSESKRAAAVTMFVTRELSQLEGSAFQEHILHCDTCFEQVEMLESVHTALRQPQATKASVFGFRGRNLGFLAAVASILLVFGLYIIIPKPPVEEIATQNGEREQIHLADGSTVTLNYASSLRFPSSFDDSTRLVSLEGEAYFDVAAAESPFIVQTKNARIKVLGTQFNIWSRNRETRLAVKEGRVRFSALNILSDSGLILESNQMSVSKGDQSPDTVKNITILYQMAWVENRLVFSDTPLIEVLEELQRAYDIIIELENPELGELLRFSGNFESDELENVLNPICFQLNLRFQYGEGKYIIAVR